MPEEKLQTEFKYKGLKLSLKKASVHYRYLSSIFVDKYETFIDNFTHLEKLNFLNSFRVLEKILTTLKNQEIDDLLKIAKGMIKDDELSDVNEYIVKVQDFIVEKVKNYPVELNEYNEAYLAYLEKRKVATEIFFQNTDNARELFELCLTCRINIFCRLINFLFFRKTRNTDTLKNIKYDIDSDSDIIQFDNFVKDVYKAFFLSKNYTKNGVNPLMPILKIS